MSRTRRFFDPDENRAYRGPSDEMLAVDAASELRSLTLLYERYADRLYRYFLLCTGDPGAADRLMRDLIYRLPGDLQRFGGQDRSFAGWLFARASAVFWREFSIPSRLYRRVSRFIPSRVRGQADPETDVPVGPHVAGDFAEIAPALLMLTPDQREVLGIHFGAALKTAPAAEALRLPASLLSSNVQGAIESLATHLDVTNTRRLSEELSGVMGSQMLSSDSRGGHFALIHGLFYGEVEPEPDDSDRRPLMEVGMLIGVVLIGLIGIWIWSLVTPGDPQDPPDEPAPVASDPPARPDPTNTPTIEPEPTLEPSPEPTAGPDLIASGPPEGLCMAAEGKAQFDQFVSRFNAGDFDGLAQMLPDMAGAEAESGGPSDGALELVHDGIVLDNTEEALAILQERYEAGERWNVLEAYPAEHYRNWRGATPLEMYEAWKRENPGLSMIIVAGLDWSDQGDPPEIAQGRAIIDCDAGLVIGWDIQSYGMQSLGSVHVGEYLDVMAPMEPGEFRMVRALVQTEQRPDGGLANAWEVLWWEAVDSDETALERIVVLSLDGAEVISYRHSGNRWRLSQREWIMYGSDGDPPFSNEITLAMPWLRQLPGLIESGEIDPEADPSTVLTEDFTHTSGGSIERFLDIQIDDGFLGSVRLRERTPNGERIRPEIHVVHVTREDSFDPEDFDVPLEPRFPDDVFTAAHYRVPSGEWEQLETLEMLVGDDQTSESYRVSWNDVEFDLTVQPSRGGLDVRSIPLGMDESWTTETAEYRFGTLVWVHRQFSGYPTDAVWDDRRYRFTLEIDQNTVSSDREWNLQQLIQLADALSTDVTVSDNGTAGIPGGGGGRFARGSGTLGY